MKRSKLFVILGLLVVSVSFFGCQSAGVNDDEEFEDIETIDVSDADAEVDALNADADGGVETIVIDEESFAEEPSIREGSQEVTTGEVRIIHFNFDSNALTSAAMAILQSNAQYLLANPSVNIVIEGHCDSRGTVAYNLALCQRRAVKVKEYYVQLGVPANRIATISYGEEQPIEFGENEVAWAANRRAETKILN
jgi:peptidoglycan-associated lipoprotein